MELLDRQHFRKIFGHQRFLQDLDLIQIASPTATSIARSALTALRKQRPIARRLRARWSDRPTSTSADHGMSRAQHVVSDLCQSGNSRPYARLSLSLSRRELAGRRAGVG